MAIISCAGFLESTRPTIIILARLFKPFVGNLEQLVSVELELEFFMRHNAKRSALARAADETRWEDMKWCGLQVF